MVYDKKLYHIHRNNCYDALWHPNNIINVNVDYTSFYYQDLLEYEDVMITHYGKNYDIDYIIAVLERLDKDDVYHDEPDMQEELKNYILNLYFLRREKALEEGRKLYNPDAPCRYHSLFLFENKDYRYWLKSVGDESCQKFLLNLDGDLFKSSDLYFINYKSSFDEQVEKSKLYWCPEDLSHIPKEYLFQGYAKILKQGR